MRIICDARKHSIYSVEPSKLFTVVVDQFYDVLTHIQDFLQFLLSEQKTFKTLNALTLITEFCIVQWSNNVWM